MKVNWQGVYPAVSTQFHSDQSLDLDASQQMLDRLINEGVHGIIVCGTVGENCSLSAAEKRQVLTAAQEVVKGRVPLISGVAETTTALAASYAKDAEKIGIDGLMVLPGMVYKSQPHEAIHHLLQVAKNTALPVMVYNNPVSYSVDISLDSMAILAEQPNIVAVKESTEDTRRISELYNRFGDRFTVFSGVDDIALESLMLGATGWISGLTNVFPQESVAIYNLAKQGRYAEALTIWRWFLPLLRLDTIPTLVQCIKLAEQLAGRGSETVRAPRLPLTGLERQRVETLFAEAILTRPDLRKFSQ
ncbi:dihydrodipicolinate synthase family protein [Rheinheimera sp. SA_1]|jgi:1-pyrroline-4-hydroxy-2-carboxylate deaminase|uniref:dihydrodipicolinate synthase family protein n=1 Tax=Rheinheimera sp. SA_1 TaxID=1827365 RepID=UPI0007FBB461|nr:dihydrodipicolinate synthase family protein [Rheinheimera sp. SA_1]OBP14750.1 dihydrodipicolinate synthase family protein [Rheinheimera sp. SA_1]